MSINMKVILLKERFNEVKKWTNIGILQKELNFFFLLPVIEKYINIIVGVIVVQASLTKPLCSCFNCF